MNRLSIRYEKEKIIRTIKEEVLQKITVHIKKDDPSVQKSFVALFEPYFSWLSVAAVQFEFEEYENRLEGLQRELQDVSRRLIVELRDVPAEVPFKSKTIISLNTSVKFLGNLRSYFKKGLLEVAGHKPDRAKKTDPRKLEDTIVVATAWLHILVRTILEARKRNSKVGNQIRAKSAESIVYETMDTIGRNVFKKKIGSGRDVTNKRMQRFEEVLRPKLVLAVKMLNERFPLGVTTAFSEFEGDLALRERDLLELMFRVCEYYGYDFINLTKEEILEKFQI